MQPKDLKNQPKLLSFVLENSSILQTPCQKLSLEEIQSPEIQQLIDDLFYTVEHSKTGVGLSANQVGRSEAISVVAIKPTPARPHLEPFQNVYINTEIIETFGEKIPMWEGCLSTATDENGEAYMAEVPRYEAIRFSYYDRTGKRHIEKAEGFLAHVLQHETDHLNGILFTSLIDKSKMLSYREYIKSVLQS